MRVNIVGGTPSLFRSSKVTGAESSKNSTSSGKAQSKWRSLLEAKINIVIGIGVTWSTYLVILPLFGIHADHTQIAGLVVVFTGVSVARQYLLRRAFNWWDHGKKNEAERSVDKAEIVGGI